MVNDIASVVTAYFYCLYWWKTTVAILIAEDVSYLEVHESGNKNA